MVLRSKTGKSLKSGGSPLLIETGKRRKMAGRTAERFERSVHPPTHKAPARHGRESCRPQGSRRPQRQFSPVIGVDADGDGVNVPEASTVVDILVSPRRTRRGSKPWHAWKEATLNASGLSSLPLLGTGEPRGSSTTSITTGCAVCWSSGWATKRSFG